MAKDAPRLEAIGALDELNAALGLVRAEPLAEDVDRLLERLQHELCALMAELATAGRAAEGAAAIGPERLKEMEATIDRYEGTLGPLREFILPAGVRAAAGLHFARGACRRAERRLVTLVRDDNSNTPLHPVAYLNRLGDLLFVLARAVNAESGRQDVPWRKET